MVGVAAMDTLLDGLKAAAEPTRLRLLALLAHGELTVTELTQILGQSQPRVSRHLKLMCEAGLLDRIRKAPGCSIAWHAKGPPPGSPAAWWNCCRAMMRLWLWMPAV
ncbi:metalloregulator ArsR/SmtB family transcription factor [Tistrella bauzanensis]